MSAIAQAKLLFERGLPIVPCFYREKKNHDGDILTKDYQPSSFNDQNNIAIQLKKIGWVAFDPENMFSIRFADKFLGSLDTFKTVRIHENKRHTVGYFFKNDLGLTEDETLDDKIMEIRADGIHILLGETELKPKGSGIYVKREISNDVEPIPLTKEILHIGKKIAFMAALAPHVKDRFNVNKVALKIDGCLKRYTKYSDEERIQFLKDFYSIVKSDFKDITEKDFQRKINGNNKEKKVAGYKALSKELDGVEHYEVKKWCNWIGKVPKNDADIQKTIISFREHRVTKETLRQKVELVEMVDGVLPDQGCVVLAAAPKSGKSVLARQLGYAIQNPTVETFLGKKINLHGDALCLFLEDNAKTISYHAQKMGMLDLIEPTIFAQGDCPQLTRGLEESIVQWTEEVPNAKLVIIDTWQILEPDTFARGNDYKVDTKYLRYLKVLADKHKLLILYLHHLTQQKTDSKWNKIMGSTGHQSVTDAMIILDRDELGSSAKLTGRGRIIKDFNYQLEFNHSTQSYDNTMKDPVVHVSNEFKREVYKAMKILAEKGEHSVWPAEVLDVLGLDAKSSEGANIKKTMFRMRAPGENQELVLGDKSKSYKLKVPHEHITKDGNYIDPVDGKDIV